MEDNSKNIYPQHQNSNDTLVSPIQDEAPKPSIAIMGFLLGTLGYMIFIPLIIYAIIQSFFESEFALTFAQIIGGVIYAIICFFMMSRKSFENIFKGLYKGKNIVIAIIGCILMFVGAIIATMITTMIFGPIKTNTNQSELEKTFLTYPMLIITLTVVIAPVVEELTWRYFVFKGLLKVNKVLAFIVSTVGFVAMHFLISIGTPDILEDLKSVLSYLVPAVILTSIYYFNKNLATTILLHSFYNAFCVVMMYITLYAI